MSQVTITINIPEGAEINISGAADLSGSDDALDRRAITRYFSVYLSDNGRRLFRAVAKVQLTDGPGFTFDDVAKQLGESYGTTLSLHRTSGRAARKWHDDTGSKAPIGLAVLSYEWVPEVEGMRTRYEMRKDLADIIARFDD